MRPKGNDLFAAVVQDDKRQGALGLKQNNENTTFPGIVYLEQFTQD